MQAATEGRQRDLADKGRHRGGSKHCLANGEGGAASQAREGTTAQPRLRRLSQGRSDMQLPSNGESEASTGDDVSWMSRDMERHGLDMKVTALVNDIVIGSLAGGAYKI
ncbi:unnamed protein product [Urochloa humidicola]